MASKKRTEFIRNLREGRPTSLTEEVIVKVANAVRIGAPKDLAGLHAGVCKDSLYEWLNRATKAKDSLMNGLTITSDEELYIKFSDAIEKAEGECLNGCLGVLQSAMHEGQWQAAAWTLERKWNKYYGRNQQEEQKKEDKLQVTINLGDNTVKSDAGIDIAHVNVSRDDD